MRNDECQALEHKAIELVETMQMTADGSRLTAYGPDENEIRVAEGAAYGSRPTADDLE